ncbi:MAG: LamG-like jellyroll fold domain-containing protein [Crocinitomicaceae bacterium]
MKQLLFSILAAGALTFNMQQAQAQCITALQLDGVDDYLNTSFGNYAFTNFTIEMWINSADFSGNYQFVTWRQNNQVILGDFTGDGFLNNNAAGLFPLQANSSQSTPLSGGNWYHVALVYDGSERRYYIDGILSGTIATTGSLVTNASYVQGLTIGANIGGTDQFANTTYEYVRIWETARSQSEITSNIATTLTGNETGLVAYYLFDDGVGSTTVTDHTGNGHDLTMMNMDSSTAWVPGITSTDVFSTDVVTNCGPYTWVDGNTYSTDNNTAMYTFAGGAVGGCDSIVTLDLTINAPVDNTMTTTASPTLSSNDTSAGVSYQWIDCGNGNTAISGETNQDFTATTTGLYAVVVTGANGCSDTSACVAVDFTSIDESNLISGIEIAPNPTNGEFSITTQDNSGELTISVMDLAGKSVYSSTELVDPNIPVNIDLTSAESGMYVVQITGKLISRSVRIVKK